VATKMEVSISVINRAVETTALLQEGTASSSTFGEQISSSPSCKTETASY
jgi:hypothetical protein